MSPKLIGLFGKGRGKQEKKINKLTQSSNSLHRQPIYEESFKICICKQLSIYGSYQCSELKGSLDYIFFLSNLCILFLFRNVHFPLMKKKHFFVIIFLSKKNFPQFPCLRGLYLNILPHIFLLPRYCPPYSINSR